ncbi:Uncharacterised protein [Kluyvera cryocrescens]|uniref:Uncharacterized protein n=1 Tax=Kluyvera cryocrescens TaxID=580 RepID=A0A485B6V6_KLUCR|nr:Uncharacterised protein [Kluyvera cryocrescens]
MTPASCTDTSLKRDTNTSGASLDTLPGAITRYSQPVLPLFLHHRSHVANGKVVVQLKTRRTRLCDLNQRLTPAVNIPDEDVVFGQAFR